MIYPKISLSEEDFRKLVAGKELVVNTGDQIEVHITLQDIGYEAMRYAIIDRECGIEP